VVRLEDVMEDCMGCVVGRDGDGDGLSPLSGSSEELGYARNKARQLRQEEQEEREEQGPPSPARSVAFSNLLLATCTPHTQHSHQTTMNRRPGHSLSLSQKGRLYHGLRGLARKGRKAGEHPAAPQTSAWNGDGVYGNSCVRCIYLPVSGPAV
jgi:hypothetical protein